MNISSLYYPERCVSARQALARWAVSAWLVVLTIWAAVPAQALIIEFSATQTNQSNQWRYDYVLENNTASSVEIVDLFFDPVLYENLRMPIAPVDWDTVIFPPNPQLGPDLSAQGVFEIAASLDGSFLPLAVLVPGAVLGGFSITFDFLGAGAPGLQPFRVFDPLTFNILEQGVSQLAASPAQVPEPIPLSLALLGLGLLFALRAIRREESGR